MATEISGEPILTHRFRLEDCHEAFLCNHRQGEHEAVKILFESPPPSETAAPQ